MCNWAIGFMARGDRSPVSPEFASRDHTHTHTQSRHNPPAMAFYILYKLCIFILISRYNLLKQIQGFNPNLSQIFSSVNFIMGKLKLNYKIQLKVVFDRNNKHPNSWLPALRISFISPTKSNNHATFHLKLFIPSNVWHHSDPSSVSSALAVKQIIFIW